MQLWCASNLADDGRPRCVHRKRARARLRRTRRVPRRALQPLEDSLLLLVTKSVLFRPRGYDEDTVPPPGGVESDLSWMAQVDGLPGGAEAS